MEINIVGKQQLQMEQCKDATTSVAAENLNDLIEVVDCERSQDNQLQNENSFDN